MLEKGKLSFGYCLKGRELFLWRIVFVEILGVWGWGWGLDLGFWIKMLWEFRLGYSNNFICIIVLFKVYFIFELVFISFIY